MRLFIIGVTAIVAVIGGVRCSASEATSSQAGGRAIAVAPFDTTITILDGQMTQPPVINLREGGGS